MMTFLREFVQGREKKKYTFPKKTFTYSISGKYENLSDVVCSPQTIRGLVQALQVSTFPWPYAFPWKGVLFESVKNEEVKDKETERSVTDKSLI